MSLVGPDQVLTLKPLSTGDAAQLLNKGVPGQDPRMVQNLVRELSCIPLAIKQAVVVMREEELSTEDYLKKFRQSQEDAIHLLDQDSHDHFRSNTPKAVITATNMTLDTINEKMPWANDLLAFLAFLDGREIARTLLTTIYDHLKPLQQEVDNDVACSQASHSLDDKLRQLKNYCLISSGPEDTYSMTEVVQLSMKAWLQRNSRYDIYADRCTQTLVASWSAYEAPGYKDRDMLIPHIAAVADCEPVKRCQNTPWDALLRLAAESAFRSCRYLIAYRLLERSTLACRDILDLEDPATLHGLLTYFITLQVLEHNGDAQNVGEDLRDRMEKVLGRVHSDTMSCRTTLGILYLNQDKLDKAEELLTKTYEDAREVLEENDKTLLHIRYYLASTYHRKERYQEALGLHLEVYETLKEKYGIDHPETFGSRSQIGRIYHELDEWDKAKEWLEDLTRAVIERRGNSHLEVACIKVALGKTYIQLKMPGDAERVSEEAMDIFIQEQGEMHPNAFSCKQTLACVYRDTGQKEKYKELTGQLVELSKELQDGKWSNQVGMLLNHSYALSLSGDLEQAIEVATQALKMSKRRLGVNTTRTASVLYNLSELYADKERLDKAVPLAVQSYEIYLGVVGKDHPSTLYQWYRARYLQMKNGTRVAPEEFQAMLDGITVEHGERHRLTLIVMYHMAWAYWFWGLRRTAMGWMERCAQIQSETGEEFEIAKADKALKEMRSSLGDDD